MSSQPGNRLADLTASLRAKIADQAFEVKVLREAGILGPVRPDKAVKMASTFMRWGASPATGAKIEAIHYPNETALTDERGSLTFEQVHLRSNALANALSDAGIRCGDGVGIMCRNHRGFVETTLATAKLGASALYLNTAFAGPQLAEVTRREGPKAIIYDQEFAGLLEDIDPDVMRIIGWSDDAPAAGSGSGSGSGAAPAAAAGEPTLERLIANGSDRDLAPPPEKPKFRDPYVRHDRGAEGRAAV